ncbi:MAG: tetratricopeptide repeat protein [Acidobacteriaceae bacterium]
MQSTRYALLGVVLLASLMASAQKKPSTPAAYDISARATVVHDTQVYVDPDENSQKVTIVAPGHEIVVTEQNGQWLRVFANTDTEQASDDVPVFGVDNTPQPVSGWIRNKGIVGPKVPNGDVILYGEAATLEEQAAEANPPKGAAQSAHLLYHSVVAYFPQSPLVPESQWRSADIVWQLQRADISTLPSAHAEQSFLRPQIDESAMRKIIKTYPGSKWAAFAAYDLLDNKVCGAWLGLPKCPEQEANLYLKYANQFPSGPKTAQALYQAAYREGVLVDMYGADAEKKKAEQASDKAMLIAKQLENNFPKSDYAARAATLVYKLQQSIPIYGSNHN